MPRTSKKKNSRYRWKPGFSFKTDPEQAGKELERVAKKYGGCFSNQQLVDEEKPERAPIHSDFEWNDRRCGQLYRKAQAAKITRMNLRKSKIGGKVIEHQTIVYAPVVMEDMETGDTYTIRARIPMLTAIEDPDQRSYLIEDTKKSLRQLRDKLERLHFLSGVIDELLKKLEKEIDNL